MIDELITHVNNQIATLDLFNSRKGLCEIIQKDDTSFPAQYCGNDEYKNVDDFDFEKGLTYHRKTSGVTTETIPETVGCESNIRVTYPMRVVAIVRKDSLSENDDAYINDKIASNLFNVINGEGTKALKLSIKAEEVFFQVRGYETDRYKIWDEEHKNIPMTLDFSYAYIAVDYSIIVEGSTSCLELFTC